MYPLNAQLPATSLPADPYGWRIPLSDVRLPDAAISEAVEVLRGGWLSMGPRVEEFEADFADYVGCEHAVACSSGTAALQLALASAKIGPGDEVVLPSLTFVAAANAVTALGAVPVFADIVGDDDLTIDPAAVSSLLTPRTRAIIVMHYGGWPCSSELVQLARDRGLALIEDAAHAVGASGSAGPCGSWGDAGCFSFFSNKNLPLGEGGMLTTDDPEIAATARRLRSQGTTASTWERHRGLAVGYDVIYPGYNFRFDEVRAAMGSVLLRGLPGEIERRGRLTTRYRMRLAGIPQVEVPFVQRPLGDRAAHHLATVLLPDQDTRDAVAMRLRQRRIQTNVHYRPIHTLSAYAGEHADLDRTEALASRILTLPLYGHMKERHVDEVVAGIVRSLPRDA